MFELGANEGNSYCQCMIGIIYHRYMNNENDAKYWYEMAKNNNSLEALYNLGILSLEKNDYEESKKYFDEGMKYESKDCEYMLAYIYFKKSQMIYKSLDNYKDSDLIFEKLPNLDMVTFDLLIPEFKLIQNNSDDVYTPQYILDITENIEDMMENKLTEMIFCE